MSALEPVYGEFGRWLRRQRRKARLTQAEAGALVGIEASTYANIESARQRVLVHDWLALRRELGDSAIRKRHEAAVLAEAAAIHARRLADPEPELPIEPNEGD